LVIPAEWQYCHPSMVLDHYGDLIASVRMAGLEH
jgi:hypothetical protein